MKLIKNSIYALSMVSLMGLWSCSQDEMLKGGTDLQGHPVTLTLTVNRSDAQTRTLLSENTQTGGLYDDWVKGDVLQVYNANGENVGHLDLQEIVERNVGVFSGTVTATDGEYNLWYTNPAATGEKEADGKPIYFNNKKRLVVDLSKMPKYTSIADLSAMNVLSKKVQLKVDGNTATVTKDETMNTHLAMARFSLKGIPSDKTGKLTIRDSKGSIANGNPETLYKLQLDLASSGTEGTTSRPEGIVVENVKAGEDIYLAFIPGTYTLSFHMEFDGVNYDYAFTQPTKLEAGKYYNAFTKAEGAEEGTIEGVNIPLQEEVLAELHVNAAYAGASPAKIIEYKHFTVKSDGTPEAVYQLQDYNYYVTNFGLAPAPEGYTFKGWSSDDPNDTQQYVADAVSVTISSYTHNWEVVYAVWEKVEEVDHSKNPLAKWAEANLVYDPTTGNSNIASSNTAGGSLYQWGRNRGFTDYNDARGTYNATTGKWQGYMVVDNDPSMLLCAGTGTPFVNSSGYGDAPSLYGLSNLDVFKNHIDKWVMNANLSYSPDDPNVDYWVWDEDGGSDWATRTKAQGFRAATPAPSGWRLPTVADFKEILPSTEINTSSSLSSQLNGKVELKEIVDVCKYVIKWTKNTSGIKIQALVVPSTFTKNDLSSVNWSDVNVVERFFPFTGAIRSTVFEYTTTAYYPMYFDYIASPLPLGNIGTNGLTTKLSGITVHYATWNIMNDCSKLYGAYWAGDDNQTFTFVENSSWPVPNGYTKQTSQFKMTAQKRHNGYALRCVKDN